jgi:hypothetical protein
MEAEVDRCAYHPLPDSSDNFNTSLPAFWTYSERAAQRGSTAAYFTLARHQAFRLLQHAIEDQKHKNRRAVRASLVKDVCCRQNG